MRKKILFLGLALAATLGALVAAPPAYAACSLVCSDGSVLICNHPVCRPFSGGNAIGCGHTVIFCPGFP